MRLRRVRRAIAPSRSRILDGARIIGVGPRLRRVLAWRCLPSSNGWRDAIRRETRVGPRIACRRSGGRRGELASPRVARARHGLRAPLAARPWIGRRTRRCTLVGLASPRISIRTIGEQRVDMRSADLAVRDLRRPGRELLRRMLRTVRSGVRAVVRIGGALRRVGADRLATVLDDARDPVTLGGGLVGGARLTGREAQDGGEQEGSSHHAPYRVQRPRRREARETAVRARDPPAVCGPLRAPPAHNEDFPRDFSA